VARVTGKTLLGKRGSSRARHFRKKEAWHLLEREGGKKFEKGYSFATTGGTREDESRVELMTKKNGNRVA